ncbi:transient receptor potential cation channel subfamily V member 3-like [Dendronephthya gigantea]|uniref:transient receptor potential cation channel subfamily V member 3-like n=1 Tax=Dendronephthya gigantea TaxID=151771 RepID=UPI00106CBAE9|nr:transient receptor potential cation channel subfamily V member 3-like [Dendronephthya gigantea]
MSESKYTAMPLEERKSEEDSGKLEDPFDQEFWDEVQKKFESKGITWSEAMDEVRVERLMNKLGTDCLLVIIRDWPKKFKGKPDVLKSLEKMIGRFTKIILEKDTTDTYRGFRDKNDKPAKPTLLHIAAKQDFIHVAKHLVKKYPGLVHQDIKDEDPHKRYLPVEMALMDFHDETAAFLISQMKQDRVHNLFKYNENLGAAKYSLGDYISERNPATNKPTPSMKKTVVAVFSSLVNPRWPDLEKGDERIERAWSSLPDDPLDYDFFYHLLERDDKGLEPRVNGEENNAFNAKSKSCLRRLTKSNNKEAIQHPVIRMYVRRKWKEFAHLWFSLQAIGYVIFLALLSYALIYGATRDDPSQYDGPADNFRLFCEVLSIIFVMLYIFEEIFQIVREYDTYFKEFYNYCDWCGLLLTLIIIPLRYADSSSQWSIASLGYLFNFLRIFKFSCVTKTTGLYTKTLAKIIYRDISRFLVLFVVVCVGFCGALFMALTATGKQDTFSNYGKLLLAAVRVLTEQQQVVEEDYTIFSWLTIILLLVYTGLVVVVLLNVLIAQLSDTYSEAKNNAKFQYSVDRMSIIARLEQWPWPFNFRMRYFHEGEQQVSEVELIEEMLEYSEEKTLISVREIMRKVVRKAEFNCEDD